MLREIKLQILNLIIIELSILNTFGTAAWKRKSEICDWPEFWASILIINKSGLSIDLSKLKVIFKPCLSKTVIDEDSRAKKIIIIILIIYYQK